MSQDNIANDLERFKSQYYTDNKKNMVFKKDQKMDLANKVCTEFDVNQLIQKTIYIIKDTNKIYMDYLLFKIFANPSMYEAFISHVQEISMWCIERYGTFECHLSIDTFTVTAAERYQGLVHLFCSQPIDGFDYTGHMTHLYVYNVPSSIDVISKIMLKFVDPLVKAKIVPYSKVETPAKLALLSSI